MWKRSLTAGLLAVLLACAVPSTRGDWLYDVNHAWDLPCQSPPAPCATPTPATPVVEPCSVWEIAQQQGATSFMLAAEGAGFRKYLEDPLFTGTVFIPTNTAFSSCLQVTATFIPNVLLYHMVPQKALMLDQLAFVNPLWTALLPFQLRPSVSLAAWTAAISGDLSAAKVVTPNLRTKNGNAVVYIVDTVLIPNCQSGSPGTALQMPWWTVPAASPCPAPPTPCPASPCYTPCDIPCDNPCPPSPCYTPCNTPCDDPCDKPCPPSPCYDPCGSQLHYTSDNCGIMNEPVCPPSPCGCPPSPRHCPPSPCPPQPCNDNSDDYIHLFELRFDDGCSPSPCPCPPSPCPKPSPPCCPPYKAPSPCRSLYKKLKSNNRLSIFTQLVEAAGMDTGLMTLDCPKFGPGTVFAPVNAAWEAFFEDLGICLDDLLCAPEVVKELVQYHIAPHKVVQDCDITPKGLQVDTLLKCARPLYIYRQADLLLISSRHSDARIYPQAFGKSCQGLIQQISDVLIPQLKKRSDDDGDSLAHKLKKLRRSV